MSTMPGGNKYRNAMVELVLLIIVAGLFGWFLILPKKAELDQTQKSLDEITAQRTKLEGQVQTLQELSQKLGSSGQDVTKLDEALPLEERQVRTQMLLEALVNSSGVLVGDISIAPPSSGVSAGDLAALKDPYALKRTLQPIAVNISVNGTFAQLMDLLHKLEGYGRIMDTNSLTVSAGDQGTLDMKLSLDTYYFGAQ